MDLKSELKKAYQDSFDMDYQGGGPTPDQAPAEQRAASLPPVTVLSASTTMKGDITTQDSVVLQGALEGNISTPAELKAAGRIAGDSHVGSFTAAGASVVGNIEAAQSVYLCSSTRVEGDIRAASAQIHGAVKGNLIIKGVLALGSTAAVTGDITAGSVEMARGAVVQGALKMTGSN